MVDNIYTLKYSKPIFYKSHEDYFNSVPLKGENGENTIFNRTFENHPNLNNSLVILFKVLTAHSPHSWRDALCAMTSAVQYNAKGVFCGYSGGFQQIWECLCTIINFSWCDKNVEESIYILGSDSVDVVFRVLNLTNSHWWMKVFCTTCKVCNFARLQNGRPSPRAYFPMYISRLFC